MSGKYVVHPMEQKFHDDTWRQLNSEITETKEPVKWIDQNLEKVMSEITNESIRKENDKIAVNNFRDVGMIKLADKAKAILDNIIEMHSDGELRNPDYNGLKIAKRDLNDVISDMTNFNVFVKNYLTDK